MSSDSDSMSPRRFFSLLWGILNRDVKSFCNISSKMAKEAESQVDDPLEPMVDIGKLKRLAVWREILDWRDTAISGLTRVGKEARNIQIRRIVWALENRSFFDKIIPDFSNEVLTKYFETHVLSRCY